MSEQNTIPTLYICQAAHNDWDWVSTFQEFYNGKSPFIYSYNVQDCFDVVFKSYQLNGNTLPGAITKEGFVYNICEIAFLQSYFNDNKALFSKISKSIAENLHIVGGGITSPSSILAYGETAIRNYLLGNNWVRQYLPGYRDADEDNKTLQTIWMPDSFGIDPNAPVLIRALGLAGFGNSRFGGNPDAYDLLGATYVPDSKSKINASPLTKSKATYFAEASTPIGTLLNNTGPTFNMIASDGSRIVAHFMFSGYGALRTSKVHLKNRMTYTDYDIGTIYFDESTPRLEGVAALQAAWDAQFNADPTKGKQQYMHVSDDMMWPCVSMDHFIDTFNATNEGKVKAVQSSFDLFIKAASKENLKSLDNFQTTPYMDGFYASCPDLKAGHLAATNTLVAAEAFLSLLSKHIDATQRDNYLKKILLAWQNLVPSTHHAYVTGLSTREVYINEQRPYLFYGDDTDHTFGDNVVDVPGGKGALTLGKELLQEVLMDITNLLSLESTTNTQKIAVFNPVGLSQERLVEVDLNTTTRSFLSTDFTSSQGNTVQLVSGENNQGEPTTKALFFANPASFGYQTVTLSTKEATPIANPLTLKWDANKTSVTIHNGDTSIRLSAADNDIAITSVIYQKKEVLAATGNALRFYSDSGSSFQFGYEKGSDTSFAANYGKAALQLKSARINTESVISGPLKIEIETISIYTYKDQDYTYVRTYTFIKGEPFVRIRTKGKAPDNYSVFVDFPLVSASHQGYEQTVYGTPYHWTKQATQPAWKPYGDWEGPYLKGSWNFVMGTDTAENTSAVIYHKGVPGWGFYNTNKNLVGCLFRAVPVALNLWPWKPMPNGGADLTIVDQEEHTLEYAFRVPGAQLPDTAGPAHPMFESMAYQNDLIGRVTTSNTPKQPLVPNGHFAKLEKVNGHTMGVLTALKQSAPLIERGQQGPNDLIMRIYQPWNTTKDLTLSMDAPSQNLQEVSALETAIASSCSITKVETPPKTTTSAWKINPRYAITTLKMSD